MILSIVLSIFLVQFQRYVIRQTKSIAITADNLHYLGDLAINMAVIAAFGLYQWTGMNGFDPAFGIVIASSLMFMAFHIARDALNILMDRELPDEDRTKIRIIVEKHPGVRGLHDMRTRFDSDHVFIELHVEMDALTPLLAAHDVAEAIMQDLYKAFPGADVIIHEDPAGLEETRLDTQIEINEKYE
jgi:ferrous-iron efflux pump FieF